MSSVTNILITYSYGEDRGKVAGKRLIDRINDYFTAEDSNQHDKSEFVDISENMGGAKGAIGHLWAKAANYLNADGFLNWLVEQNIYDPEQFQIFIRREYANDDVYQVTTLDRLMRNQAWSEIGWVYCATLKN